MNEGADKLLSSNAGDTAIHELEAVLVVASYFALGAKTVLEPPALTDAALPVIASLKFLAY